MVDVEQITIDISVPSDAVPFVAMQPFVRLEKVEPFQWLSAAIPEQLEAIRRTLDLAQNGFNGHSGKVTLFPEYSIPGNDGVSIIEERVISPEWPNDTVIIAGIHGLRKSEYEGLVNDFDINVSQRNSPDTVQENQWVNCCLIWVKTREGVVQRWLQPKIRPAWPEMRTQFNDMYSGSTVYVFEARYSPTDYPCRFVTFICFDWVAASRGGNTICDEVLGGLNNQWNPEPRPLHWAFVIQHNPGPNHPTFLNSTYNFLTDDLARYPLVERQQAVVIHANTAASSTPARNGNGAFSACVFSPESSLDCTGCRPTVRMQPATLRGSVILERCKDVVFREMGECIHLFEVCVPRFAVANATGRTNPLRLAEVYPTIQIGDPRLLGGPVPAIVKWINDVLDKTQTLSTTTLKGRKLEAAAKDNETEIIINIRALRDAHATDYINWAACSVSGEDVTRSADRQKFVDSWDESEEAALEHIMHSLTSLSLMYPLHVTGSSLHGTLELDDSLVQVVSIRGESHVDCLIHYDKNVIKTVNDPVLVIVRDRDNVPILPEEFSSILDSKNVSDLKFLDYQTLVNTCRTASDVEEIRRNLNECLPESNRII